MAGEIRISGKASIKDAVSGPMQRVKRSISGVRDDLASTDAVSERVEGTFERLSRQLNKTAGSMTVTDESGEALRRTLKNMEADEASDEFWVLSRAIDNAIDSGDIANFAELRHQIRNVSRTMKVNGADAQWNAEQIEKFADKAARGAKKVVTFKESVERMIPAHTAGEAEVLGQAIDKMVGKGDALNLKNLNIALAELGRRSTIDSVAVEKLQHRLDELSEEEREAIASGTALTAVNRSLARSFDDVGDESRKASRSMDGFGGSAARLSADLGLLHVSLQDFFHTVPLLATLFGPLTKTIGGLTVAIAGMGGALGGLMVGGMLGWAKQLDAQFASIEGTGEAMMVIMKALGRAIMEALEPLMFGTLADGTSNMEVFLNILGGLVDVFAVLAYWAQKIIALEEFQDFLNAMGESLLGETVEEGGLAEFMRAIYDVTKLLLPELTKLFRGIGGRLPDMIREWGRATKELLPYFTQLVTALIAVFGAFSRVGEVLMKVALPWVTTLFYMLVEIVRGLESFGSEIFEIIVALLALAYAISVVSAALTALRTLALLRMFSSLAFIITALVLLLLHFTGLLDEVKDIVTDVLKAMGVDPGLAESIGESTLTIAALIFALTTLGITIGKIMANVAKFAGLVLAKFGKAGEAFKFLAKQGKWLGSVVRLLVKPLGLVARAIAFVVGAIAGFLGVPAIVVGIVLAVLAAVIAFGIWSGKLEEAAEEMGLLGDIVIALLHPIRTFKDIIAGIGDFIAGVTGDFSGFIKTLEGMKELGPLRYVLIGLAYATKFSVEWFEILATIVGGAMDILGELIDVVVDVATKVYEFAESLGLIKGFFKVLITVLAAVAVALAIYFGGPIALAVGALLLLAGAIGWVLSKFDGLAQWLEDLSENFATFTRSLTDAEAIVGVFEALFDELLTGIGKLIGIDLSDVTEGLVQSLRDAFDIDVVDIVTAPFRGLDQKFKQKLGFTFTDIILAIFGVPVAILTALFGFSLPGIIHTAFGVDVYDIIVDAIGGTFQKILESVFSVDDTIADLFNIDIEGKIRSMFDFDLKSVVLSAIGITLAGLLTAVFWVPPGLIASLLGVDIREELTKAFDFDLKGAVKGALGGTMVAVLTAVLGLPGGLIASLLGFNLLEDIESTFDFDLKSTIENALGGTMGDVLSLVLGVPGGYITSLLKFNAQDIVQSAFDFDLKGTVKGALGGAMVAVLTAVLGVPGGLIASLLGFSLLDKINSTFDFDLKSAVEDALGGTMTSVLSLVLGIPGGYLTTLLSVDLVSKIQEMFSFDLTDAVTTALGGKMTTVLGIVLGLPAGFLASLFGFDLAGIIQTAFSIDLRSVVESAIGGPATDVLASIFSVEWSTVFNTDGLTGLTEPLRGFIGMATQLGLKLAGGIEPAQNFKSAVDALLTPFTLVRDLLTTTKNRVGTLTEKFNPLKLVIDGVKSTANDLKSALKTLSDFLKDTVGAAVDWLADKVQGLIDKFDGLQKAVDNSPIGVVLGAAGKAGKFAGDVGQDVGDALGLSGEATQKANQQVGQAAGRLSESDKPKKGPLDGAIGSAIGAADFLGDAGKAAGNLIGGLTSPQPGSQAVSQNNQTVQNIDQSTVNVNVSGGDSMDSRRMAREVAQEVVSQKERRTRINDGRR